MRSLAGTPLPEHRMAVMADATTKACRFASAGEVQKDAEPRTDSFFGATTQQVQREYASGQITSKAQQRWKEHCEAADAAAADEGPSSCSANLSCSRASASARGLVDIAGAAGVVCAHAVPGLGCFTIMPTPEQHYFHLLNILHALKRRPDIKDIYIDVACRLLPVAAAMMRDEVEGGRLNPDVLQVV
jgi:hypothetical protein